MSDKSYSIVAGSGISGLTAALLLAIRGHNVVIVEKMPFPGGLLNRFKRKNLFFDTGFHFTGGFRHVFPDLLRKLGIDGDIVPKKLNVSIFLEETKRKLALPNTGCGDLANYLGLCFPDFREQIKLYYEAVANCVKNMPMVDLNCAWNMEPAKIITEYDSLTVDDFLDQLKITNAELRTALTAMAVCHGSPPSEAPFPYHARCTFNMDEQIVAVKHGGSAFINAMLRELKRHSASIMTATTIQNLQFDDNCQCKAATISNGITLPVDKIVFTMAPQEYMHLLPQKLMSPNMKRRFDRLTPTCSFFTLYGKLDGNVDAVDSFTAFFKENNISASLLPKNRNYGVGMVTNREEDNDYAIFTAFKTCFAEELYEITGLEENQPYRTADAYRRFKKNMTDSILNDVYQVYPEFRGHLEILDAASPLTCKRYTPPIGSAYGTRQMLAQSRLPVTVAGSNCHILGHHAQFPGILGSMLSAFTLFPV